MENGGGPRRGFGLKHVSLIRTATTYGFAVRLVVERAPAGLAQSENLATYFVGKVIAGGSAEGADMCTGDRIVSVNGTTVTGLENAAVLHIIKTSKTLDLLLIPGGEQFVGLSAQQRHIQLQRPRSNRMERRPAFTSHQKLHSILDRKPSLESEGQLIH